MEKPTESISRKVSELRLLYQQRRMANMVGWGLSPAVIVIDFINAFTDYQDRECLLAVNYDQEVKACLSVLEVARDRRLPVIFTTVEYDPDLQDAGLWRRKIPAHCLIKGTPWVEVDPRLAKRPGEWVLVKKFASAFFGTSLASYLQARGVDTLVVTGCVTSGCVRATTVDAMQSGFHAIVVREAVGDRDELIHEVSLSDLDSRYADVVDLDKVLPRLETYGAEVPSELGGTKYRVGTPAIDGGRALKQRGALLGARIFAVVLACVVIVAAWVTSAAAQTVPVVVRWGGIPAIELMTPTYIAMTQGFFEQEGIKIQGPTLGTGDIIREAMAAGELDFSDIGILTYLVGRAKGLPQRIVFEYYTREFFSIFVRAGLKDKVKTVRDLRGLKVGVLGPGSASWVAALAYLRKEGLDQKDVQIVFIGSPDPATWLVAFESARIDAGIIYEPTVTVAAQRGSAFPLLDVSDPETHRKYVGDRATSMVLVATEKIIAEKPEVVQRVVNALKKASSFIYSRSAREVAEAMAPRFRMDVALAERVLQTEKPFFSKDGTISRSGIGVEVDLAYNAGILKRRLSFEEMVDTKFVGVAP